MKVAIITPVYPPYKGGMGAVAANDAHELKARGFAVTVYTPNYPQREQGSEAEYLSPVASFGNAAVLPQLVTNLNKHDLVHLHYTFYGADMFVWLWSLLSRKPYVLTYHMQPKTNDWREVVFRLHRLLLEPLILRQARAVLVSSLDYAQSIGLQHQQLVAMPFGVDTKRFLPGHDDEFRNQHQIPLSATVFVFVGGLDKAHSFKGIDILIRATAALSLESDWRLLIVGDGDMRSSYVELARAVGVAERVVFVGAVSELDLVRAYHASDVHILPSITRSEAFGLVTLEAAASGLPSIVSNLPGVRSLVVHQETGLVIDVADEEAIESAMSQFLLDSSLAERMGAKAREHIVSGYTKSQLADRLVEVYNRCAT